MQPSILICLKQLNRPHPNFFTINAYTLMVLNYTYYYLYSIFAALDPMGGVPWGCSYMIGMLSLLHFSGLDLTLFPVWWF